MYSIFVQDVYRMRRTNAVSSMHLFSLWKLSCDRKRREYITS
jgi:hypothetical protein